MVGSDWRAVIGQRLARAVKHDVDLKNEVCFMTLFFGRKGVGANLR